MGFEWAWRLMMEPRKLWKRYLTTNTRVHLAGRPGDRDAASADARASIQESLADESREQEDIAVFMGTRPEAIKLAPVVTRSVRSADFACSVVATGQHKEMFRQVTDQFGITVDADLDVMRPNQTLAGLTSRLMAGIDGWLEHGSSRHGARPGRHDDGAGARRWRASIGAFPSATSRRACAPATSGRRSPRK